MYISSIPGAGTTVEPTIPVSNTNEKSYYHEQSKLLCNTTVIIVDDDPDTLKRAANILHDIGFGTIESDCYSRALEQISQFKGTATLFIGLHLGANKTGGIWPDGCSKQIRVRQ